VPKNYYQPVSAEILWIEEKTSNMRLFGLKILDQDYKKNFTFLPGQFIFISLPGHGESAISITSPSYQKDTLEILVRKVGTVTNALFALNIGAKIGIRGPFGNGIEVRNFYGKDIIVVAGGCGAAPMRSVMKTILKDRKKFGKLYYVYGAKTPKDVLFKDDLMKWQDQCKVLVSVEMPDYKWEGKVGMVTSLFDDLSVSKSAIAITCGSPVMFKYVLVELKSKGLADKNIFLSLERRMKCGIGKCQHCTCGDKYACIDGPVFSYDQIKDNFEAV
jgi:sulfhydrogenase subunit gamma (sulfur reductase)